MLNKLRQLESSLRGTDALQGMPGLGRHAAHRGASQGARRTAYAAYAARGLPAIRGAGRDGQPSSKGRSK